MSAVTARPPGVLRRAITYLLALLVALTSTMLMPLAAQAGPAQPSAGSPIIIDDVAFENDEFPDGSRQSLKVRWSIDGEATNPVTVRVEMPANLRGYNDSFPMAGPDGEAAGTCEVRATYIECTADADFITENPFDVSGDFFFDVYTTFENREEFTHTFDIGGFENEVIIGANPNWCYENCGFGSAGHGKWGSYDNLTDTIIWTVQLPGGSQGMTPGQKVTVTDLMDTDDYEVLEEDGFPRVIQSDRAAWNKWGRESLSNWHTKPASEVTWSDDNLTAEFRTADGLGRNWRGGGECITGSGDTVDCQRGFDGIYYQVQWKVKVNTPGEVLNDRQRRFYNAAEYTIEGKDSTNVSGSSTRTSGGATVVGRNFGKFQVTKELSGDTTLNPEFEVSYSTKNSAHPSEDTEGTFRVRSGETFTSQEYFRGTEVTLEEVTPTDPSNVTWADPVFVDGNGDELDLPFTFDASNSNLGTVTKISLRNKAELQKDVFSAKKSIVNEDSVPLPDDLSFRLDYTYPADADKGFPAGSGSLTLPANGDVVTSDELPVGAVLTLSEATPTSIPGATWGEPELSTTTVTIGEGDAPVTVDVTNTLTQDLGGFRLTKDISGDGENLVAEGTEFTVNYSWTEVNGFPGGNGTVTVKAGEPSEEISTIPAGAVVTLDEVAPVDPVGGTWGEPQFDVAEFTVVDGQIVQISLDNPISWNDGDFSVVKVVEGDASHLVGTDVAFTVDYTYQLPEGLNADPSTGTGSLTVLGDGQAVTSEKLPYDTEVTLSEVEPGPIAAATWTGSEFDHSTFTIGDETTFAVELTNSIELDLGGFSIEKLVTGNGEHLVPDGTEFTVDYSYPAGPNFEAGEGSVTLVLGEDPAVVDGLPANAVVTLEEIAPSNPEGGTYLEAQWAEGNVVTIGKDGVKAITLENVIGLNDGYFSVVKEVEGAGSGLITPETTFAVEYSYPAGPGFEAGSGVVEVRADGTAVTSDPLPYGAQVTLTEAEPEAIEGTTWTGFEFSPSTLTIGDGTTVAVTATNGYDLNEGFFSVTKAVEGSGSGLVPADTVFTVEYSYPAGNGFEAGEGTLEVKADGETVTSEGLPYGAEVTLTEVEPVKIEGGTWLEYVFSTDTFTIGDGTTVEIMLTNVNDLNSGHFSVVKELTGAGSGLVPEDTVFTVEYSYPAGTGFEAGEGTLDVRPDGVVVTSEALPYGAELTLTEVEPEAIEGTTWTGFEFSPETVTIGDETTVEITLTNGYDLNEGFFSVTKAVEGSGSGLVPDDTVFTVEYSYPAGIGFEAGEGTLEVKADGETVTSEGLPYGAEVTLDEVEPVKIEGGDWVEYSFSASEFVVGDGTTVEILLTNVNELGYGHFSVAKSVDGSGAGLVGSDAVFTVEYSYPAGTGFEAGQGTLEVKADGTAATSEALPYGAELTLSEADPAAVEGGTWTGHVFSTENVTIGEGTTVEVSLANTITADEVPAADGDEAAPGGQGGSDLPRTGLSPWLSLMAAAVLIAAGVTVVAIARRRRSA